MFEETRKCIAPYEVIILDLFGSLTPDTTLHLADRNADSGDPEQAGRPALQ